MNQFAMPPVTPVPFDGILVLIWIGVFLIIGMLLRSSFSVFRRYLIPACIIGGVLGLICQSLGLMNMSGFGVDNRMFQLLVYHLFNLTWVFLGLKLPVVNEASSSSTMKKGLWWTVMLTILLSAGIIVGAGASTLTNFLGLSNGPDSLGSLVAYGFVQGPGQALTIAKIWEAGSSFTGLSDFAMAGASMGFAVAIILGIILMNIIARKKNIELLNNPSPEESCGYYDECSDVVEAGKVTTSPSNIDVFAWHIALGLGTYFLTLILSVFLLLTLPAPLKPLVWTVFFILCCIVGMGVRTFIIKINKKHLLCNGVNARISNTLVDFLVCGTFISIQVGNVVQYAWPYFLSVIGITLVVALMCWFYCRKLEEEGPENFAFLFGTCTGTISTGLILLRMIDPQGKSQAPVEMAIGTAFATPLAVLLSVMIHMEIVYKMSVFSMLAAMTALTVALAVAVLFIRLPKTKKAWQAD